jgi:short subunit dehydrogenase-like uncharacterized protein
MQAAGSRQGRIVVYGATGYTGKLVAAELDSAGADYILSGRNPGKLAELSNSLPGRPPVSAVSLDDGAGLRELLSEADAVIACAGPFHLHGEPILQAAIESGTHYLDTTGEQTYMRMAIDSYGSRAKDAGVAVVPAMGFDYVPGDMIAALTAGDLDPVDKVRLAYRATMQPTHGTMLSALEMIKGGDLQWRDGVLRPAPQKVARGKFDFGPPLGTIAMTRYPAGEHVTVPRHIRTRTVETALSADSFVPAAAAPLLPLIVRPGALLMRTPVRHLTAKLIARLPEGASPEVRDKSEFTIACEVTAGSEVRRGRIVGRDVYGLTAALIVKGAMIAASGGVTATGGLAPSEAFDPASFLEGFERFGLEWTLG